ncbi:MAG: hypothetical protein HY211_00835 [Candidatus Omnitrophica bacterium]|nr:hypothetical protein [Candidatus Omnitrophota bacterium]
MINVTVRSNQGLLLKEAVPSARLPGVGGDFEVMGFHVPLIAVLAKGRLWVGSRMLAIRSGLAWVVGNRLTILVET